MSTDTPARPHMTPDQRFAQRVDAMAKRQCARLLGTERGQQAAQRITMAILGAMQTARSPQAFHDATDLSLADCIALSAQTGLLPGGPNPSVYLVPQAARRGEPPALQWRITHRGLCVLAYRAGFALRAVPVHVDDHLTVSLGEVLDHTAAAESWPESLAELRGVAVIVRDLARGQDVIRAWVPAVVIDRRRRTSRDGSVWEAWPIEMAQKTAIKYAFARGSVPIDSPELSEALAGDSRADIIDTQAESAAPTARPSRIPSAAALPDHGEVPDLEAEVASLRESVPVESAAE